MVMCMAKPGWPVERFRAMIDDILRRSGMTKVQLAALIPIDQSQISRWANGTSRPKYESLHALGVALRTRYPDLGVGPDDLTSLVYPDFAEADAIPPGVQYALDQREMIRQVMREELERFRGEITEEIRSELEDRDKRDKAS